MSSDVILFIVVGTALAFDFTNGFHDTANVVATSISTGAARPSVAIGIASALNFLGAFISISVAATVANDVVNSAVITPTIVFAGLIGAIAWNLITWSFGLPSSSSHALFGGLIGATLVAGGTGAVHVHTVVVKVLVPAVISPVIAGLIALTATFLVYRMTAAADAGKVRRAFRAGQMLSASTIALAHGANDAQKTMGVITLTLITAGILAPGSGPPFWVVLCAGLAIGLGTYMGGWRIIRTLGRRISDIETPQGFTADTTSASIIMTSTHFGIPLSTTQVCSGAIFGAGAGRRSGSVHWSVAGRMVVAWAVTLPAAAVVGAVTSYVAATGPVGVVAVTAGAIGCGLAIYLASRRNPVTALNVNDVQAASPARAVA